MLRPTFMGFDIAKRGIQTSQKGLDIVGQNMTNWDSTGYTRQRVDQVALASNYYATRFSGSRIGTAGQGVNITGIGRIRDSFLDKRYRDEYSDEGYYNQSLSILYDIETAIGEYNPLNSTGLRGALGSLEEALQNFTKKASDPTHANIVQTEFKNMVQTLNQLYGKLNQVESQQKYNMELTVNSVNSIMQDLANLNYAISQSTGVTINSEYYGPNELLDTRDALLDQLSRYVDIDVTHNSDYTVTVKIAGMTAVEGDKYEKMSYSENSNGTVALKWLSSGKDVGLSSGSVKGFMDFLNGRGTNVQSAGETHYKGLGYYRDQLNTFAQALVSVANNTIPDTVDANGNVLTYKELLGAVVYDANGNPTTSTNVVITAENISLSKDWQEDYAYIIFEQDSLQNDYINDLYAKLFSKETTFRGVGETFKGTFYEFVDTYVAVLGEDISFYNGRYLASATIVGELEDSRDAISGVVMDEEVTNMLMYNKSLQAASRLMTALDEALDVLINRTGLVGR